MVIKFPGKLIFPYRVNKFLKMGKYKFYKIFISKIINFIFLEIL